MRACACAYQHGGFGARARTKVGVFREWNMERPWPAPAAWLGAGVCRGSALALASVRAVVAVVAVLGFAQKIPSKDFLKKNRSSTEMQ